MRSILPKIIAKRFSCAIGNYSDNHEFVKRKRINNKIRGAAYADKRKIGTQYAVNEPVPHSATISYNFRHRFTEDIIEKIFTWILYEARKSGYLSPETAFMDGTHIKANINKKMKSNRTVFPDKNGNDGEKKAVSCGPRR